MKTYTYNVDLNGLKVLKTKDEQHSLFCSGHPQFLIPDFHEIKMDIWQSFMEYLEKGNGAIYDQDGGEITSKSIIDPQTGLTKCTYEGYGISFNEEEDPIDYTVVIEGYVIEENTLSQYSEFYFLATKVTIL